MITSNRGLRLKEKADSEMAAMLIARQSVPGSIQRKNSSQSYKAAVRSESEAEMKYQSADYDEAQKLFFGSKEFIQKCS